MVVVLPSSHSGALFPSRNLSTIGVSCNCNGPAVSQVRGSLGVAREALSVVPTKRNLRGYVKDVGTTELLMSDLAFDPKQ